MASVAATAAVRSVQATIAIGALSVWIASQLPDCLEAVDACSDLYNLFPLESPTSTIPRSSSSSRPRATAAPLLSPRSLLAAALLISSFRIFGFYLSLLALFLFLLCYFTGTPVYSYSQAVRRSRRLNSFFSNARRPSFPLKFKLARPRFRMLRKQLLSKGKEPFRPLYGASSKASIAFARWGTDKTSALIRSVKSHGRGIRKAAYYSTVRPDNQTGTGTGGAGPEWGPGLPLYRRIITAWTETPTKWYPLPIAVGALLLVAIQYRKKVKQAQKEVHLDENGVEVVKLKGPWHVHVLGALPLRNMSRLWGYINSLELPVWFRPYGFKLYAHVFGCNLDEIEQPDLTTYKSLGDFFYRKLKPGVRPVDGAALVSPADGTILHFGTITDLRVEQVKGITYSLDAFLGVDRPSNIKAVVEHNPDMAVVDDEEFANVNGIEYSLGQLLGGGNSNGSSSPTTQTTSAKRNEDEGDASVVEPKRSLQETIAHDVSVVQSLGMKDSFSLSRPTHERRHSSYLKSLRPGNSLFFTVVYLAPGDYHRFHSPTAWVVEKRRHFVGELFSVSPWMAKRLEGLFVLNERVALLGRWRYGFFGMVPVGATNVGSIVVNFDQNLRTNVRGRKPPPGTYNEAVYSSASTLLNGQPLVPAQEMGGFKLGSTVVLVFEAPDDFEFAVRPGQKVKVGQKLGDVDRK